MNPRINQLLQLLTPTWDGNLMSKSERDNLVGAGLVERGFGWQWITRKGVETLLSMGLLDADT